MPTKNEKFSKVPILDGTNYLFWKARMQIYLKSKDERIWRMVIRGFTTTDGTTSPKPKDTWDDNDLKQSNWNNQGLNTI